MTLICLKSLAVFENHSSVQNSFEGGVLMDLTKAFDAINHRLSCLWIQQTGFVAIICSYLSNRRQRMKINNVLVLKKI